MTTLNKAITDVMAERWRQDAKWGGPGHDDHHTVAEWVQLIEDYAGWARVMAGMNSPEKARNRLIQVAALAVAAVEAMDRTSVPEVTPESLARATGPIPAHLKDEFIGYLHHSYNDDDAPDGAWFAALKDDALEFMLEHKLSGDENDAVHQFLDWVQPSPLSDE
jgi:hypothetical protein